MSNVPDLDWEALDPDLRAFVSNLLDTDESLAEFMATAAEQLRNKSNPFRIAHYLDENAAAIRHSRARIMELIGGTLKPEPAMHQPLAIPGIMDDIQGWRAGCACGWRGEWRLSAASAADAARTHAVTVQ